MDFYRPTKHMLFPFNDVSKYWIRWNVEIVFNELVANVFRQQFNTGIYQYMLYFFTVVNYASEIQLN